MVDESVLGEYLKPMVVPLDQLFLDPNNPRYSGEDNVVAVDASRIREQRIQDQAMDMIQKYGVKDLKDSILKNGFLITDRIVVSRVADKTYVVIEGNRRLACLKLIREAYESGDPEVSERLYDSIAEVEVLIYTGPDKDASWTFQAVRHLAGIRDWKTYQKAKAVTEKWKTGNYRTYKDLGRFFGLGGGQVSDWVKSYMTYAQAREDDDLGGSVGPSHYPYFQELQGRSCPKLREWLKWDADKMRYGDEERFRDIMYLFVATDEDDKARITRAIDLREVNRLCRDHYDVFSRFIDDEEVSLNDARAEMYAKEGRKGGSELSLEEHIAELKEYPSRIRRIPILSNPSKKDEIIQALKEIQSECDRIISSLSKL